MIIMSTRRYLTVVVCCVLFGGAVAGVTLMALDKSDNDARYLAGHMAGFEAGEKFMIDHAANKGFGTYSNGLFIWSDDLDDALMMADRDVREALRLRNEFEALHIAMETLMEEALETIGKSVKDIPVPDQEIKELEKILEKSKGIRSTGGWKIESRIVEPREVY